MTRLSRSWTTNDTGVYATFPAMIKSLAVTLVLLTQSALAAQGALAASQVARELVRCERSGGSICRSPDDPGLSSLDPGCTDNQPDGEYLLVPRIGPADSVPTWEQVDQENPERTSTYKRCGKDRNCHEIEVRAERVGAREVRLVGQNRWRDYSLELRSAYYATDPPIPAIEVQRFLGTVIIAFWRCPATLSYMIR